MTSSEYVMARILVRELVASREMSVAGFLSWVFGPVLALVALVGVVVWLV